jgi:hypothetical protein
MCLNGSRESEDVESRVKRREILAGEEPEETGVDAGRGFVDPDPGLTDSIRSTLGWADAQEGDYEIATDRIERVSEDKVVLKD